MKEFLHPNTTQIPNILIDEVMPDLSDTEFRVLLVICRQTLGWIADMATGRRKAEDWISYSQLVEKTGRNRQAISKALKGLKERDLIHVLDAAGNDIAGHGMIIGQPLFYRLNVSQYENHTARYENQSLKIIPTKETHTKDTVSKDTERGSGLTHSVKGFSSLGDMARQKLADIEAKHDSGDQKKGGLQYDFQAKGFDIWSKLRLPKSRKSAYIMAAKKHPWPRIQAAYSSAADIADPTIRDLTFFKKLNELAKEPVRPGLQLFPAAI